MNSSPPTRDGLGPFRRLFMPLGLVAFVALGVHAGADQLDDLLRAGLEVLAQQLPGALASELTSRRLTWLARGLALGWELAVDLVLGWPMLGYRERVGGPLPGESLREIAARALKRPSQMALLRPLALAGVALGACEVLARLTEARLFLALQEALGVASADKGARLGAAVTLLLVLGSLAWRAVLQGLVDAESLVADLAERPRDRLTLGLPGTLLALPLAAAALLSAASLAALVR